MKAQLMGFDTVRIRSVGGADADRVEIIHNVNPDNYDIIVLVVGCCRLYDRQGKRLTTPSQSRDTCVYILVTTLFSFRYYRIYICIMPYILSRIICI